MLRTLKVSAAFLLGASAVFLMATMAGSYFIISGAHNVEQSMQRQFNLVPAKTTSSNFPTTFKTL